MPIQGCTTAVEDGTPWVVEYAIQVDRAGATRSARITGRSAAGSCSTVLDADGAGHWLVDGENAPQLDGCLDVDLESSAVTNALPVRRLGLAVAAQAPAPAAYVRAVGLAVDRLEQTYLRTPGEATHQCYDYTAPAFDFKRRLTYDQPGLVLEYPGIAVRAAGVGHRAALRQLANRLVGSLHGCLKTRILYDEATAWPRHARQEIKAAA